MKIMREVIFWKNATGFLREEGRLLTLDRHLFFSKHQEIFRRRPLLEGRTGGAGGGVRTVHMFPPKQYKKNLQHLGTSQLATPPSHMRVPISLEQQGSLPSSSPSGDLLFLSKEQDEKTNEKREEEHSSPYSYHTSPSETSSLLSSSTSSLRHSSSLSLREGFSQDGPLGTPASLQDERRCSDTRNPRPWSTSPSSTSSVTVAFCPVMQQEQASRKTSRAVEKHQEKEEESSRGQIEQVYKIVQELNNTRRWYHHQIWHAMTSRNWALLDSLFSQFLENGFHYDEVTYTLKLFSFLLSHRTPSENVRPF
ncbi:hypothetical protein CSUI_003465 [Cystoisospora suis]|uniref:Uncharacterized protein n=1 Tax=Cystoisospora suis TaxID=483139 RepID=A0A2C6L4Z1_9APIC|nr:hypothetical protein CSUI_003465 [Cystoisospora suis]